MKTLRTIFLWCCVLSLACQQPADKSDTVSQAVSIPDGVIRIGSIADGIKDEVSDFQPFADFLAQSLHDQDVGNSKVVVKQSLEEMEEAIRNGEVDLYVDSPLPILLLQKRTGLQPFLRRWKKGRKSYHTVFFVHKDSPIQTLHDLRGHLVAFDDPHSTTGYLLPKATMQQAGFLLQKFETFENTPDSDMIGYVFSNDDENTLFWVLKQRVSAGVIDDDNFDKLGRSQLSSFRVIHRSIDIPRHVVAHRADLADGLVAKIRDLLVEAHTTPKGRDMLRSFQKTAQFDDFEGDPAGALADLDDLLGLIEADFDGERKK